MLHSSSVLIVSVLTCLSVDVDLLNVSRRIVLDNHRHPMSSAAKQDDSDDEFESADEGESIPTSEVKPATPPPIIENPQPTIPVPPAINDAWDNWNVDDEPLFDKSIEKTKQTLSQQNSTSSLSSSPSKTGGSLSHNGSDEDDPNEFSEQQRLQRKKLRKKATDSNLLQDENKINARISRRDDDSSSTTITKHHVKDAHHVLDRLAAQSPTRTVCAIVSLRKSKESIFFLAKLA